MLCAISAAALFAGRLMHKKGVLGNGGALPEQVTQDEEEAQDAQESRPLSPAYLHALALQHADLPHEYRL